MYLVGSGFRRTKGSRPHWHPNDRFVTVLEGTWYTGTGDTFDVARAVPLKAGEFHDASGEDGALGRLGPGMRQ